VTIVSELFVYPIKSARGIRIQQATLDRRGFEHDRRWMLVDSQRKFISQRTHPRLALVSTSIGEDLKLSAPRMEDLHLPLRPSAGAAREVQVWDDLGAAGRIMQRIKAQLDPKGILNPGRFVAGI